MELQFLNMNELNKAIFLDRDGVLNYDRDDYVKSVQELKIKPNIFSPIKRLKENGYILVVVTNQSAINKGLTTHENVKNIHITIQNFLKENSTYIDEFFYCPHRTDENCNCRKPKTGLLQKAILQFNIDIKSSWLIGDRDTDIQTANFIGCRAIKLDSEVDLSSAVDLILK
jgi:D-glycero-D-manno-heptose 1,7-bisphosphate phosphatase